MTNATEGKWTQKMLFHLNCGEDGHRYGYEIFRNDEPTKISLGISSRNGKVVGRCFTHTSGDEYDMLSPDHTRDKLNQWLEDHTAAEDAKADAAEGKEP